MQYKRSHHNIYFRTVDWTFVIIATVPLIVGTIMKSIFNGLLDINTDPSELRWAQFFHADIYTINCTWVVRVLYKVYNWRLNNNYQGGQLEKWYSNGKASFETNDISIWNVHESEIGIKSNNIGKSRKRKFWKVNIV